MNLVLNHLIFCMLVASCNINAQKTCTISISNNSSQKIDSIKITSYGLNAAFANLPPYEKAEKTVTIDYDEKYEGAFVMLIYVKDSVKGQATFGYFSSASDIKSKYQIEILNDFRIKEK